MICIPVLSESRTLAKADLVNAARLGDIVELCLDRFAMQPDVADLVSVAKKPVLVSCRRRKDGGGWDRSEEDRLALLQEALAARPAYIELELDVAARFPKTPSTQRVVSVNSPFRAIPDLPGTIQKAIDAGADVVKLVWPGLLVDSLEPVLDAIVRAQRVPIVGQPIGPAARAFAVLARKYGAHWIYAALERGMETFAGTPLYRDLDEIFGVAQVDAETKLVGAIGFGVVRDRTLRAFNAGFRQLGLNVCCLPLEIGSVETLRPQLDQLQLDALIVTPNLGDYLLPLVEHPEPAVALGQHVDLLLRKKDGWHGYNVLWRSALKVLERTLKRQGPEPQSLERTNNLVLGAGRLARTILFGIRQLKGTSAIASPSVSAEVAFCPSCGEALSGSDVVGDVAQSTQSRAVPFAELARTRPDVLIVTEPAINLGFTPSTLNPLFLEPPLTVLDVTSFDGESDLISEARARGCTVVRPAYILGEHIAAQFRAIAGEDLPDAAYQQAIGMEL